MDDSEGKSYLLTGAAWQETLLQSYRALHITIQSILLAIGIGLTVASLTISSYPSDSLSIVIISFILTCVAGLQIFSTQKFRGVVLARGTDINWWHKAIIREENDFDPKSRFFTQFKIHQQARRKDVSHLEKIFMSSSAKLTEEQIDDLIGRGLGHTRIVIDKQLFFWISCIWWLLLVVSWSGPILHLLKITL